MKLIEFKVEKFKTIENSGVVETKDITALIGENESGKTNLLLPLWKLNPASIVERSKLKLLDDYPKKEYTNIYNAEPESLLKMQEFISATFLLDEEDKRTFLEKYNVSVDEIILTRNYNDKNIVKLIAEKQDVLLMCEKNINSQLEQILNDSTIKFSESETNEFEQLKCNLDYDISTIIQLLKEKDSGSLNSFIQNLEKYRMLKHDLITKDSFIYKEIPKFIYYSEYDSLDSAIYLPDFINNNRPDSIKGRTLNTLFDFVNLTPKEIYEMGNVPNSINEEQKKICEDKIRKRQTLLESAEERFTESFNAWWGQGNYRFKFIADGDFFRIKVSDSVRNESIELEQRSKGLQWFFSFYLVFLVESKKSHKNTILLLDEPGLTLHPNSQKDLYKFFENLASKNQLIYSTHSPFMINPNQLDKVYAVYVNENGKTEITSDLRHTKNKKQNNSIYPAFAALGLNVSDTLLQGCVPVIVEGISDQIYFAMIKNGLISKNLLNTNRELVFIPSTGVKGITSIIRLLSCIESNEYPYVIIDGDEAGNNLKKSLEKELYKVNSDKLISLKEFGENMEVEDLLPSKFLIKIINSYLPKNSDADNNFEEEIEDESMENMPICDMIDKYCTKYDIKLDKGYKVEIAKKFKDRMLNKNKNIVDEMNDLQKKFIESTFKKILN